MASVTMAAQAICVPSPVAASLPHSQFASVRTVSMPALAPLRSARRLHVVAALQPKSVDVDSLAAKVERSIQQAQEVCAGDDTSKECVAQWDEVEELSAAAAHKKAAEKDNKDPLEAYCKENPETDECRVYED